MGKVPNQGAYGGLPNRGGWGLWGCHLAAAGSLTRECAMVLGAGGRRRAVAGRREGCVCSMHARQGQA